MAFLETNIFICPLFGKSLTWGYLIVLHNANWGKRSYCLLCIQFLTNFIDSYQCASVLEEKLKLIQNLKLSVSVQSKTWLKPDRNATFFRFELNFKILKLYLRFQINSNGFSRNRSFGDIWKFKKKRFCLFRYLFENLKFSNIFR